MRGKSGVKYIVNHPIKGRILVPAFSMKQSKEMIGMRIDGGVCIGVVANGRPVADNEPPTYRANKPVKTRRVDNLPSCVKRLESVSVPLAQPSLPRPRYNGFQRCDGASVDKGVAYDAPPVNTYYTATAMFPKPTKQERMKMPVWEAVMLRELYRDHAWLRFEEWPRCVEPPKVYHSVMPYEFEVFEDCMDRPDLPVYTAIKCKDKPLTKGFVLPHHYTPAAVITAPEEDILTRVMRLLGKVAK